MTTKSLIGDVGLKIVFFLLVTLNLTDNVLGSWIHEQLGNPSLGGQILYVKYIIVAVVFVIFCVDMFYGLKLKAYQWYGIAYIVAATAILLVLTVTRSVEGSRFYSYTIPVMTYFVGVFFGARAQFGTKSVIMTYAWMYIGLSLVFAALNVLFGPITIWRDYLNYTGFILDVKGFTDAAVDGLHGNFFYAYSGHLIPRFVGSFGDPLALSYAGMIIFVPLYYVNPNNRIALCALVIAIVGASITRAVFVFLPLSIIIYWIFRQRGFAVALGIALVGIASVLLFGDVIAAVSDNSSTSGHVETIADLPTFLNPTTLLTGSLFSNTLPEFEPGLFNVLFLFGIVPFVCLLMFFRGIYHANSYPGSPTPYIAILILVALITLLIVSGVFFATTSAWFAWFLAGFASKRSIRIMSDPKEGVQGGG